MVIFPYFSENFTFSQLDIDLFIINMYLIKNPKCNLIWNSYWKQLNRKACKVKVIWTDASHLTLSVQSRCTCIYCLLILSMLFLQSIAQYLGLFPDKLDNLMDK